MGNGGGLVVGRIALSQTLPSPMGFGIPDNCPVQIVLSKRSLATGFWWGSPNGRTWQEPGGYDLGFSHFSRLPSPVVSTGSCCLSYKLQLLPVCALMILAPSREPAYSLASVPLFLPLVLLGFPLLLIS